MAGMVRAFVGLMLLVYSVQSFAVGAIAVDESESDGTDDIGFGIGFGDTKEAATRDAMKECRSAGNKKCVVKVWFEQCGAYAVSRRYYGVGWGNDKQAAERNALKECGNSSCKVVLSDCDH